MSNYDGNLTVGITTMYHNTLGLQNWNANGKPTLYWFEPDIWANGSQWMEGRAAGDPTTVMSSGSNYVYATSDLTNLYNIAVNVWSPNTGANDIKQATRSIIWLNNDYIVVYDRATSIHPNLFKRFNLCLVNSPKIAGNKATQTMDSGQQLFIQTLLPLNPSLTVNTPLISPSAVAQLEPTRYIFTAEDPTKPSDVRFLHVLQGANTGVTMTSAAYLKSTSGTAFDGAAFGNTAVYFPVLGNGSFTGTTLSVTAAVNAVFVTGLASQTSYTFSRSGNVITIAPGSAGATAKTDNAGVLKLTF